MPRYIDADEIYYHKNCGGCEGSNCEWCEDYVARKSDIDDIATADVQEVKHGKWVRTKLCNECSICRAGWIGLPETKYCPNCGARMNEEVK